VFYLDGVPNGISLPSVAEIIEPSFPRLQSRERRQLLRVSFRFGQGDTHHHLPETSILYAIEHALFSRYARRAGSRRSVSLFFGTHPSDQLVQNDLIPDRRAHHPLPGSTIQLPRRDSRPPSSARLLESAMDTSQPPPPPPPGDGGPDIPMDVDSPPEDSPPDSPDLFSPLMMINLQIYLLLT